jgi:hypothetical protein
LPDKAFEAINRSPRAAKLHDLFFVEKLEYPTFAWQEAIVNAGLIATTASAAWGLKSGCLMTGWRSEAPDCHLPR